MSEMDVIRQLAQQALTVPTPAGTSESWLWDRTLRIVRNVEHICRIPELTDKNAAVDQFCLIAAAYFADAGFAHYADAEDISVRRALADVSQTDHRDFSTQVAADKLAAALAGPRIDKICKIIIESSNRFTTMTEAMILSDARNLEDIGAVGLFSEFGRYALCGKGVSDMLESWKRKVDYRYWQARLKESYHFESIRRLAERRFRATEYFMNQLDSEHNARDLEELLLESPDNPSV